jgi:glycosyltransferase involved in cell wall biosynthesis
MVATPGFPSIGGIETHINEVASRLAAAGADVTVLTTDSRWRWPTNEQVDGARIRPFRAWPTTSDYSLAPGIYRAITRGGWDLVHCQGYYTLTAPIAMRAASAAGIPYLVTLHSGGHSSRFRNLIMQFQWKALRLQLALMARIFRKRVRRVRRSRDR